MNGIRKKNKGNRGIYNIVPCIGIIIVLIAWHLVTKFELVNSYLLPSPHKVSSTFMHMIKNGEIVVDVFTSLFRVVKGFCIAFVIAFICGGFRIIVPRANRYYEYMIQFFRNVPPMSMIPLLILWCGIGETTKIVIIVMASFFPMYLNITKGFLGCDKKLLEVGEIYGYNACNKFRKIILPYAMPDILVGMRIGMGYSIRAIIGAEMVAASSGLGHMILFAQQMSRTDKVIVGILIIGLVGISIDKIFGMIIKRTFKVMGEVGWN